MAQQDRDKIVNALKRKGFKEESRDHIYLFYHHQDKKTSIYTKISRGSQFKTYDINLLSKMKNQLHITLIELNQLIDCSLTGVDYQRILKEKFPEVFK